MLVLLPAWALGAFVYRRLARSGDVRRTGHRVAAAAVAGGSLGLYLLSLALDVPHALAGWTADMLGPEAVRRLRFSDEFLWNGLAFAQVFERPLRKFRVFLEGSWTRIVTAGAARAIAARSTSRLTPDPGRPSGH